MIRKLASVQLVIDKYPIVFLNDGGEKETAQNIESIKVLGWNLVAQKNQFNIGDKCVYVEIDSILPEKPEFEFLRKCCFVDKNGFKGFLVKTKKMRGVISQGIALPMSILPEGQYEVGNEVTNILGIVKYDPPLAACLGGIALGNVPSHVPTPDEERVHAIPEILNRHRGERVYASLKCDGSSMSLIMENGVLSVCSKNINLIDTPTNTFWTVARRYDLSTKMKNYSQLIGDFIVQGELVGPGVRGNRHGLKNHDIYVFSVYSLKDDVYFGYKDALKIANDLGLKFVPIIDEFVLNCSIEELEKLAYGPDCINPKKNREGIVIRPVVEGNDIQTGRFSFKVIAPKSLL